MFNISRIILKKFLEVTNGNTNGGRYVKIMTSEILQSIVSVKQFHELLFNCILRSEIKLFFA